jgi:hypothetical protein
MCMWLRLLEITRLSCRCQWLSQDLVDIRKWNCLMRTNSLATPSLMLLRKACSYLCRSQVRIEAMCTSPTLRETSSH